MHIPQTLPALFLLVAAALAGLCSGLAGTLANLDCLAGALPHLGALLAELAPLAPAAGLLVAGTAILGIAGWLMMVAVDGD